MLALCTKPFEIRQVWSRNWLQIWFFQLPKFINTIQFSGATKVAAGGVFVHARPFVTCASFPSASPASVEIGDLLLIRALVVNGKVEERRALPLQAKKTDGIPAAPDNKNQWHLYEQWPGFTYATRSGGLNGKKRHIKEPDMYEAAKYLLIGSDLAASCWSQMCPVGWLCHLCYHRLGICAHYTAQPTTPELSQYRCFASELVDFLAGNAGKIFDKPKAMTRGWNRVIQDLIDETAKAQTIFMGRAAGQTKKSTRGSGLLFMSSTKDSKFFSALGGIKVEDSRKPPDVPDKWGDGDGGGISIIEFVIEQGES